MSMFSLQSGDSQSVGRQIMRRPRMLMQAHMHRLQHKLGRSVVAWLQWEKVKIQAKKLKPAQELPLPERRRQTIPDWIKKLPADRSNPL